MSAALRVVADPDPAMKPETVAQRVRRLQAEAKQAVRDHTHVLSGDLLKAAELMRSDAAKLTDKAKAEIAALSAMVADLDQPASAQAVEEA